MRRFKFKNNINWKYVFGEIFLIFVGINLAIWFNNWNTSKHTRHAKKVAIERITEEIKNNRLDLDSSYQNTVLILNALDTLRQLYKGTSSEIIASPSQMGRVQSKYPGFFSISDSTKIDSTQFLYNGQTKILLELIELSEIAWETTKTIDVLNEFGYECLYDLEGMYSLQRRTQHEINKAGNALQNRALTELERILAFLKQLEEQLKVEYDKMLENMASCH